MESQQSSDIQKLVEPTHEDHVKHFKTCNRLFARTDYYLKLIYLNLERELPAHTDLRLKVEKHGKEIQNLLMLEKSNAEVLTWPRYDLMTLTELELIYNDVKKVNEMSLYQLDCLRNMLICKREDEILLHEERYNLQYNDYMNERSAKRSKEDGEEPIETVLDESEIL